MTTGQRMKQCRKEIGISAELVAAKLKVSPATIYRYENGGIDKVPGDLLEPIADALQTTPAYLMGWDEGLSEQQIAEYDEAFIKFSAGFVKAMYQKGDTAIRVCDCIVNSLGEKSLAKLDTFVKFLIDEEEKEKKEKEKEEKEKKEKEKESGDIPEIFCIAARNGPGMEDLNKGPVPDLSGGKPTKRKF